MLGRLPGTASESTGARRVMIACSGGPDSVALVGLMLLARRHHRLELSLGHVNHGLRSESLEEATLVRRMAQRLELPLRITELSLEKGPSLPARARDARRAALREQAQATGAEIIALGHTQTDQCETMLMHLVRGAGLDGLSAMPEWEQPWLRPLLAVNREETRSLADRMGLAFADDPTNLDRQHLRVRLRHEVLPSLRAENPRVESHLCATARQARDADEALASWARTEENARREEGHRWNLREFQRLPRAVRSRVIRLACERAGAEASEMGYRVVEQIDTAAVARASGQGTPSSWDLNPRRRLTVTRRGLEISKVDRTDL